jgi:hypothetical protein
MWIIVNRTHERVAKQSNDIYVLNAVWHTYLNGIAVHP